MNATNTSTKAPSARMAAVLAYVEEHPGVSHRQVAAGLNIGLGGARKDLESLYVKRLVGRQASLFGFLAAHNRWLWYAAVSVDAQADAQAGA